MHNPLSLLKKHVSKLLILVLTLRRPHQPPTNILGRRNPFSLFEPRRKMVFAVDGAVVINFRFLSHFESSISFSIIQTPSSHIKIIFKKKLKRDIQRCHTLHYSAYLMPKRNKLHYIHLDR